MTKSAGNCRFGQIYWRNPLRKTSFFLQWHVYSIRDLCANTITVVFLKITIANGLTHQQPMFPLYKNQSIHLQCKPIDWFLYDGKHWSLMVWRILRKLSRSSQRRCSVKKSVITISQNSQENTCAWVTFLIMLLLYYKRDFVTCVFWWTLRNFQEHSFIEHLQTTTSKYQQWNPCLVKK